MININIAAPHGFCAGVERAISIVDKVLQKFPAPIYVRHEVVHNRFVVDNLKAKGAIFIEDLQNVPIGAVTIFSAHGVSQEVRETAKERKLQVFDATCPLVTKVHVEVAKLAQSGKKIIMIGHIGHPEVEGTMGQLPKKQITVIEDEKDVNKLELHNNDEIGYVTQTTLSQDDTQKVVNALQKRFTKVSSPKKSDICYATQNRQEAVKAIATKCDLFLIIGSKNSSNSNRLREVAQNHNCEAYLIDNAKELNLDWLTDKKNIGISAGASAPEILVQELIERLKIIYKDEKIYINLEEVVVETIKFPLPIDLVE